MNLPNQPSLQSPHLAATKARRWLGCAGEPVPVLRATMERPESVESGVVPLVGTGRDRFIEGMVTFVSMARIATRTATAANPYNDGLAAVRIRNSLARVSHT